MDREEARIRGVTICPGVGLGTVFLRKDREDFPRVRVDPGSVRGEQERYRETVRVMRGYLHRHVAAAHASPFLDAGQILRMHQLILEDETFHRAVVMRIEREGKNAEWALAGELQRVISGLEGSGDPYIQARAEDIRDMAQNLIATLASGEEPGEHGPAQVSREHVVVSPHLFVSDVMRAQAAVVRGFVTESVALTSHGAILLKSSNIPAIGQAEGASETAAQGDPVLVDADHGVVIIRPSRDTLGEYERRRRRHASRSAGRPEGRRHTPETPSTRDGTPVHLLANIDNDNQIDYVLAGGMEGVGLFRTEFLVVARGSVPGEEEQYAVYRRVLDSLAGMRVVFRTFDLGADKSAVGYQQCTGRNPALGMRGIRRHLLQHPGELRAQLSALLRAGGDGEVDILLPMVTMPGEVRRVRELLEEVRRELGAGGEPCAGRVRLGAMIEVPAAAFSIREILSEADFVSVGTNDLVQYFTAADRDNEAVMRYYGNLYSAPFRGILRLIVEGAAEMGREGDVSLCGEIAADRSCIPDLLRMGFRTLSLAPVSARAVREVVAATDLSEPRAGEAVCGGRPRGTPS